MKPLREWTEGELRAALKARVPQLAAEPLELSPELRAPLEIFHRGIARVGTGHFVKAAWSEAAAAHLLWQARLLRALEPLALPLQIPTVVTYDPVLVVHPALGGEPLRHARADATAGAQIGRLLARLHDGSALALVERAGVELGQAERWCQADVARLRRDLVPRLGSTLATSLVARLENIEHVLGRPSSAGVLVHGDVHGHNLLFDATGRVSGVLDFESCSVGEPEFDFRYLPAVGASSAVLDAAAKSYGSPLDLDRILSWHLLTDLGDALWRTEQGVGVEFGPLEHRVELALERTRALSARRPR